MVYRHKSVSSGQLPSALSRDLVSFPRSCFVKLNSPVRFRDRRFVFPYVSKWQSLFVNLPVTRYHVTAVCSLRLALTAYTHSFPIAQKTRRVEITKITQLMMFRDMIAVETENQREYINAPRTNTFRAVSVDGTTVI
jgi:hypothetical protein